MARNKTKTSSSWHKQYDQPRRALQGLLESFSPNFANPSIKDRFDNESYEDYVQGQQDSQALKFALDNPALHKSIEEQSYWEKEENDYNRRREDLKDAWNRAAENSPFIPKYENTPFVDKVADVMDFIDNKLPGQNPGYTKFEWTPSTVISALVGGPGAALAAGIMNSDWGADVWNHLGRKMNDFQIGDYQGYMDRATLLNSLVESEKKALQIEQFISDIDKEIQNTTAFSPESKQLFPDKQKAKIQMLINEKQKAINELNQLKKDRDALDSYKQSFLGDKFDDAMRLISPISNLISNNFIFGKTTKVRDELSDIVNELNSYDRSASFKDRQAKLESAQKMYADKMVEWKKGIDSNIADKDSYGKVSDFYQRMADKQEISFFDPNTYFFGLSGLAAGSASSLNKQIPAMVVGFASGNAIAAGALTGDVGAIAGGVAGTGATYYLNRAASISESNSEVSEATTQKLRDALVNNGLYNTLIKEGRDRIKGSDKLTDEDIFDAYRRGEFNTSNTKIQDIYLKSLMGIESRFQDEMTATTFSDLIDTGLEIMPMGSGLGAKLLKTPFGAAKHVVKSNKYWRKFVTSEPMKKAIRSRLGQNVLDEAAVGFERGTIISPIAGAINIPLHIALSPAEKYIGNAVRRGIAKNLKWTSDALSVAPEEMLTKALTGKRATKYFTDLAGRMAVVGASEGIEEGKQSYISDREYDSNVVRSVWDSVLDDFIAGSKSAALILGMPFDICPEEDRKRLNDIKGGMLMGMFGPSTVVSTISGVKPFVQEQSANKFILENFLNNKFDAINRFNKGVVYAEKAKSGESYNSILQGFDRLKELNSQTKQEDGSLLVDPSIIDAEVSMFKKTAQQANNPYTIKSAEAQGIKQGTPEYNQFVSTKIMAMDDMETYSEARKQSHSALREAQDKIITKYTEEQLAAMSDAIPGQQETSTQTQPESHKMGYAYVDVLAHYVALLKRKQEIEVGLLNAKNGNKTKVEQALNEQSSNISAQLDAMKQMLSSVGVNIKDIDMNDISEVEKNLVYDRESHDILVPLYKEYIQDTDDLQLAVKTLNDITGKLQIKDGENWRDITNDDYANLEAGEEENENKFNPARDINKVRFVDGKAKDVLSRFANMVKDDAQFEQDLADAYKDRIVKTAKALDQGAINKEGQVVDQDKLDQIEKQPDVPQEDPKEAFRKEIEKQPEQSKAEPEKPAQKPAKQSVQEPKPQIVQPKVEQKPAEQKPTTKVEEGNDNPIRTTKPEYGKNNKIITQDKYDNLKKQWRKLHGRLNSGPVTSAQLLGVMTEMAVFHIEAGVRKFADFCKSVLEDIGEETRPYLKSAYLAAKLYPGMEQYAKEMDDEAFVTAFDVNNFNPSSVGNDNQKAIVESLKRKAEESKKYTIEVTPEYYLIKVGNQEIKMQRVHSVMPESWVEQGDKDQNAAVQASLQVGGAFDTLARMFFSNKQNLRRFENDRDAFIDELFNENVEKFKKQSDRKLNKTFAELYKDRKAFEQTVFDLYKIGREYEKIGWELVSEPIVWYNKFKKGWVAGETDMVAVDTEGNIHIIDFKTAKGNYPFQRFLWNRPELTKRYSEELSKLTKADFTAGPRGKGITKVVRELKSKIGNELKTDKIVIAWNDNLNVAEIQYVNSNFYSTNGSQFRTRPKSEEYSDQLTAYSEMIKALTMNVVDLEILGFRTSYSVDYASVKVDSVSELTNSVNGRPLRIKLSFSDEMKGILNNEGPVDAIVDTNDKKTDSKEEQQTAQSVQTLEIQKNDKNDAPVDGTTLAKPDEPSLDSINVKRKDHNGAYDHVDFDYARIKHDKQFTDDTNAYDFIDWLVQNAGVELYTEVVNGVKYLYADINYKGHEYKRVYLQTHIQQQRNAVATPAGAQMIRMVEELEKVKKPGQKIVASKLSRTAGQIGLIPGGKTISVLDSGLLVVQNLSDVELNSTDGTFGFVKNGDVISFKDGNFNQQIPIYTYKGRNISVPQNGTFIYIKSTNHSERKAQQQIPVTLTRTPLSNDADFIINCLKNIDNIDRPYIFEQDGKQIRLQATAKQLLSLLIPYANNIQDTDRILSIVRDNNNPSIFRITSKNRTQPVVEVNILDPISVNNFRQALSNLSITELHRTMGARLGDVGQNALPVFANIRKFFADKNNTINTLNISPSLKFDIDDFKMTPSSKNPNITNAGLSGFGWMLKNGWFVTQYGGMNAANVGVEDVSIVSNTPINNTVDEVISPEEQVKSVSDDIDSIMMDAMGFVFKRETQFDANKPKLTKEQVKKNLRPILGDMVDDPNLFKILDIPYDQKYITAKIVGKASSDAITIYSSAFAGVEYHEAFHRIFELYVPEHTRDFVYNKVAKQLGIDLSKSTTENNFYGHRIVAEHVADLYMDRKLNRWGKTKYAFLNKALDIIQDICEIFKNIGQFKLYHLFLKADWGSYKNAKVSNVAKERFDKLFGELNYEIHGTNFDHILDDVMYEDVKDTAFYLMTLGQKIDLSGANVSEIQITPEVLKKGAEAVKNFGFDVFGQEGSRTAGQLAMLEIYDKFYAVSDDLAAKFSQISTDYVKKFEEDEREKLDGDEESIASANYEEQIKASYEFSKFDKTSSRVKFFFSLLPDMRYTPTGDVLFVANALGMPKLISMNYVFNEVLTNLCDIDTIDELLARLDNLAKQSPMFHMIKKNVNNIVQTRVENGKVNADKEALLAQLMTTIRSNRHTFMIARSEETAGKYTIMLETSDASYNAKFYPMEWSQILAKGGTDILKANKYGRLVFNPNNGYASIMFSRIGKFFDSVTKVGGRYEVGLKQMLSPKGLDGSAGYRMTVKVIDAENSTADKIVRKDVVLTDLKDQAQCSIVKDKIVEALNTVGIRINSDEFEYMLNHKYGSSDYEALQQMVTSVSDEDSMQSFLNFLNTISYNGKLNIDQNGNVFGMKDSKGNPVSFDKVYEQMAFIKEIGNWKWAYRKAHDQLTVLALDGNRFYEMSDNDYIADVLRGLNKRDMQFEELKADPYNYFIGERNRLDDIPVDGSITLKQLTNDPTKKLLLRHFIGFKTDKKGDQGSDYFEISRREDYLSKTAILENGGIIMLTLSDKKKYVYIDGVKLPGFDYNALFDNDDEVRKEAFDKLSEKIIMRPSQGLFKHQIQQNEDVVEQMLSYARAEYESAKKAGREIDAMIKAGTLKKGTVNYYTKQQGAKLSSLLGVWENQYNDKGGITGEHFISFNDGNHHWSDDLRMAEIHFFDRPEKEQKALIARNLQHVVDKELKTLVDLGLINKEDNDNPYLGYSNAGLNSKIIDQIADSYKARYSNLDDNVAQSLAVVMYVNDISAKAIISGQEVERLFSGNPAFYKWKYDKRGRLVDRTVDELKRLGGIGSTGTNNFLELANIPEKYIKNGKFTGKYVQAEVDNEMIESIQIDDIRKYVYDGQLRYNTYLLKEKLQLDEEENRYNDELREIRKEYGSDIQNKERALHDAYITHREHVASIRETLADNIYNASIEDLEKDTNVAQIAKIKADEIADAYIIDKDRKLDGIDVADGGAYVTDEMCEMMLRMVGAYTKEVEQAFDILRGRVQADYLKKAEAYEKVLTTVIGNQKYTAFGRRLLNGVSTPYYNKMALFPIFECIATGRMKNIFDKMKQQGIDILAVNSAVKVGSEGSKPVVWNNYRVDNDPSNEDNFIDGDVASQNWKPVFEDSFEFNTYEQDFAYLRKQLNTDPSGEEMMRMGTQAQKVAFSNLIDGKTYITQNGEEVTGNQIRNDIMSSMRNLSEIGTDKLNKRFFVTNEEGLPVNSKGKVVGRNSSERLLDKKKFAEEVSKMMSERGADKNVMKAIEYVNRSEGDSIPLGAISNAGWIESVLVSVINKEIIDVNTPGAFFIQRSIWAMEGSKMVDRSSGQIKGATLYNGKELKMINDKNSMDCVLSLDFFEHILPKTTRRDEDGNIIYKVDPKTGEFLLNEEGNRIPEKVEMSFEQARKWLIDHNIIGDGATANIMSYRIPTQAESSIHALRCVDVLPVVRDTVILPKEFTKITGSDFDIDKLGLSWLNYNKQGTTEFEEGTAEYYQNKLLQSYITLLTDKDTMQILQRSIDNDTELLKNILKEIEENSNNREMPYMFYSLSTQTERKNDYITGKIGIGPFALNNNNHILTMMYDVKFKNIPGSIMSELGLTNLASRVDKDGNSILSWISALINAHVDIAKDPYVSRLNVNPFTYNLVNTLIRTGFGRDTFYFTTQPIMMEMAKAYMNAQSAYMADPNKTQYTLQKEAVTEVAKSHFEDETLPFLTNATFDDLSENVYSNPGFSSLVSAAFAQLVDKGSLKHNANKEFSKTFGGRVIIGDLEYKLTPNQVQYIMYLGYLLMDPYAKSVSNLVKYSKIDTKKQGNNYTEQQLYKQGFKDLFYGDETGGLFDQESLKRMANDSYIGFKTTAAIAMTEDILKGHFLQATSGFNNARQVMLNMIGRGGSKDVRLNNKISSALSAAIKSEFFNDYARRNNPDNPTYIRDLVSESFEENLLFHADPNSTELTLSNDMKYKPSSYINGGRVSVSFVAKYSDKVTVGMDLGNGCYVESVNKISDDRAEYTFNYPIVGANDDNNSIYVPFVRAAATDGKVVRMTGGKNTIYDRFNNLKVDFKNNPDYADILDNSGEPRNMLLRSLVPGRTFEYSAPRIRPQVFTEMPDTYSNLKFLKLFNALDNNGVESNYIIDAWDQLLHDTKHPALQKFAEDLVVYAFVTSGDKGGFTKFFKQVPLSWRMESGYGSHIQEWINDLTVGDVDQEILEDAVLNNWFDNDFVRTFYTTDKEGNNQFVLYSGEYNNGYGAFVKQYSFPIVAAAIKTKKDGSKEASIDPEDAPLFIKLPRKENDTNKEGQRKFTVFRLQDIASQLNSNGEWVRYPVYVKVNPKGVELSGNFNMTEYGRSDSVADELAMSPDLFEAVYKVNDFISKQDIENYKVNYSDAYADAVQNLNFNYLRNKLGNEEFNKRFRNLNEPEQNTTEVKQTEESTDVNTPNYYEGDITPDGNTIFVFGSNPEGRHGAGAAKVAREQFGAIYGQGEGLQGNSYALPTKDLRVKENNSYRSISPQQIVENIRKMYEVAKQHSDKQFKVAYKPGRKLNGYTDEELIGMFKSAGEIPSNVLFSKEYVDMWDDIIETPEWRYMEDSGYSGILEQLNLSEKVPANDVQKTVAANNSNIKTKSGMIYRPKYDFGRIYLTDEERKFIDEKINAVVGGTEFSNDDILHFESLRKRGKFDIDNYGKENYTDDSIKVDPGKYKSIINMLDPSTGAGLIKDSDWSEDGLKVSLRAVDMAKFFEGEPKMLSLLETLTEFYSNVGNSLDMIFKPIYDTLYDYMHYIYEEDGSLYDDNTITYSYKNNRQLELFSDDDFELTEEEREEAKRYKQLCEGE